MKLKFPALILAMTLLAGCLGRTPPSTQTHGGGVTVTKTADTLNIEMKQPSNPDEAGLIHIGEDGVTISTGSSRKDEFAGLGLKLDQYKTFSYVGAGVCVLGIGLFVASFWFPLIPKLAGPMVFIGGALTAYMSTAIPEYGPYFLIISLVGAVAWFYHHTAGKKDPQQFLKKKNNEVAQVAKGSSQVG